MAATSYACGSCYRLLDRQITPLEFQKILRIRRTEFVWAVVAFAGVVLVGTLKGIVVAIIVSLVALAY